MLRKLRLHARILLCILCLLTAAFSLTVYADTIDPNAIVYTSESGEPLVIRELQEKLKELGYLDSQTTYELDQNMLYALKQFCKRNNLPFSDEGITYSAWYALLYQQDLLGKNEMESEDLALGAQGENVTKLQMRLKELGYYGDATIDAGTYDSAMQKAVEKFCKVNHLHYVDTGINKSVQEVLLSDVALPYTPPIPSAMDNLRTFLLGHQTIKNVRVPNLLWLAPVYLLLYGACMGLTCAVFKAREKKSDTKVNKNVLIVEDTSRTWRQYEANHCVDFHIHYNRNHEQLRADINHDFTIGRKGCSLNLDRRDRGVSKQHCKLRFFSNVLKLEDVSTYGTYVNEQLIKNRECELHSGDRIQIGEHLLIIRY